ncbi:hypothetical protein HDU87_003894 [Geranomyces variabilis]|uniref:Peptidase A1 domain-containing protein n=1 Tax=Geranomyces variabilis TaxID=109894 RepID=A0AAD5XQG9_9FUNG|nr:hypothetical protein HDU87_003894 [Geranomyces variabilis]
MKLTASTAALALALSATSASAAAVPPVGAGIPLTRPTSNVTLYDAYPAMLARVAAKFGGTVPAELKPPPSIWAADPLGNDGSWIFYGPVTVGGQVFQMDFDTGSSDIWIPDVSVPELPFQHKYDRKKSKTFKNIGADFSIQYGLGSATGKSASEEITIAGVTVKGQVFGDVTTTKDFYKNGSDGVFGLAFPALLALGGRMWIENAMAQGTVTSTVFGVYLSETGGSELVISGYNPNHFSGEIGWIPVLSPYQFWTVNVVDIRRNGATINPTHIRGAVTAILDTGTTLVVGPNADITKLNTQIGAKLVNGRWTIPCERRNAKDKIDFVLNGFTITLTAKEYVFTDGDNTCISTFSAVDMNGNPQWILGDTILRKYYSIYDMGQVKAGYKGARVGLALAKAYS